MKQLFKISPINEIDERILNKTYVKQIKIVTPKSITYKLQI